MRRAALIAGLFLLALIWLGPLLGDWRQSFTAHMLAHMGVVAIAAPLIAIGLPDAIWRRLPMHSLVALPVIASLLELLIVWGWHAPAARALVERSGLAGVAEQASFLAGGLLLWIVCIGSEGAKSALAGAFGLLLTSVHMTLLGALLALSPRPLYGLGDVTCFGVTLTAAQDQELGGVVMLLIGAAVYLAGGVALLARALREPARVAT
ncbi:cytochrome c oxidase assembly protein [Mesorhizobium sp. A556]